MANHKEIKKSAKNVDRTKIHPAFPPSDNPIYPPSPATQAPDPSLNNDPNIVY